MSRPSQPAPGGSVERLAPETSGHIGGRVVDEETGLGIAGIPVEVWGRGSGFTTTDAEGRFTVGPLPVGADYTVSTWDASDAGYLDAETIDDVVVTAEAVTELVIELTPAASISGTVRGAGADGAVVVVESDEDEGEEFREWIYPDGDEPVSWSMAVPSGDYVVSVRAEGGGSATYWRDASTRDEAEVLSVSPTEPASDIDLVLQPSDEPGTGTDRASISGRVSDGASGISGAEVWVEGDEWYGYATTADDGTYRLDHVPAGTYTVGFALPDSSPSVWFDGADSAEDATPVVLAAGTERTGVDATLALGGVISGTVTSGGQPAWDVSVTAVSVDGESEDVRSYSDEDGIFRLLGLSAGDYVLEVAPNNGMRQYYPGVHTREEASVLTVDDERSADVTVAVAPGASVSGRVVDVDGDAVSADVELTPVDDERSYLADQYGYYDFTSDDGTFNVTGVPPGEYVLTATPETGYGMRATLPETLTISGARPLEDVDVVVGYGHVLTGTVSFASAETGGEVLLTDAATGDVVASEYLWSFDGEPEVYYFYDVPPGAYVVEFRADTEWGTTSTYYDGVERRADAETITLGDRPSTRTEIDGEMGGGATITGTVRTVDGEPAAGTVAQAYRAEDLDFPVAEAEVAEDGTFELTGLAAANYVVRADSGDTLYVPRWHGGDGSREQAAVLDVPSRGTVPGADVTVPLGGRISGTLSIDEVPEDSWAQGRITLYEELGDEVGSAWVDLGEGSGEWDLPVVEPGRYTVELSADGYATTWWESATSRDQATVIELSAGEHITTIDAVAAPLTFTHTISGTLTHADGTPAAGVDVEGELVVETEWGEDVQDWFRTMTAADGSYTLPVDGPGTYRLRFSDSSSVLSQYYPGTFDEREAELVVLGDEPVSGIDQQLLDGIAVTGTVVDALTGAPVEDAMVTIYGGLDATTAADGSFVSAVPRPGTYDVEVDGDDHHVTLGAEIEVGDPAQGLVLSLTRGATVSGTVTAVNNGIGLWNIQVRLINGASGRSHWAWTGADGSYVTPALPSGEYDVEYTNYGGLYVAASSRVTVGTADVTGVDMALGLGGRIVGQVLDESGEPVADVEVGMARRSANASTRAAVRPSATSVELVGDPVYTDEDGRYELPPAPVGDYGVYFYREGYATTWFDGKATFDEADLVTVGVGETATAGTDLEPLAEGEVSLLPEQTLSAAFAITLQPQDASVEAGEWVVLRAAASGTPLPAVRWQVMTPEADDWQDIDGETSTTLGVDSTDVESGTRYRAVFTQGDVVLETRAATLTVAVPATAPGQVAPPSVTDVTDAGATISWEAPADNGAPITGYTVEIRSGDVLERSIAWGTSTTVIVSGLSQGTTYEVSVTAHNSVGAGPASTAREFTTLRVEAPSAVVDLAVADTSPTGATVSWSAPQDDGGGAITGYVVVVTSDGTVVEDAQVQIDGTTAVVTGLVPETAYVVSVAAVNSAGTGPSATVPVLTDKAPVVPTAPGVVRDLTAAASSRTAVSLTWAAPAEDGGATVTRYDVVVRTTSGQSVTADVRVDGTEALVDGLAPGTAYEFSVAAVNSVGSGEATSIVAATAPAQAPGAVRDLAASATSPSSATVTWQAPTDDGGAPVTGYHVAVSAAGDVVAEHEVARPSAVLEGLPAGSELTVTVTARNAVGHGPSASVGLTTPPVPPTEVTPADVTFHDAPGTTEDTVTVPAVDGVDYLVDDEVVPPGTRPGTGTVTVTARAQEGFVIAAGARTEWRHTFSAAGPEPEPEPQPDLRTAEFHLSTTWRGSTDMSFMYGRWADEVFIGDWDGDGKDTIAVRRGKVFHVSNSQRGGNADVVFTYGRRGDVILVGDWDGDGTDTFAVRRGAVYHVKNSLRGGEADSVFRYGREDDAVMVGDWDGNGTDTFAVRRAATFHVKNSLRGGDADTVFTYGRADDVTLAGDWDGNGTDTFAVQRGRTYHVNNSLRGGVADTVVTFGRTGDEVYVGDWDGNGTDTLGIRRPVGSAPAAKEVTSAAKLG